MAKESTTEIMMQFIGSDSKPIKAECTTRITENDELANTDVSGFGPAFSPGGYFLVDSFRFSLVLKDGESSANKPGIAPPAPASPGFGSRYNVQVQVQPGRPGPHQDARAPLALSHAHLTALMSTDPNAAKKLRQAQTANSFLRWRSTKAWDADMAKRANYTARVEEFSFTRRMDKASLALFDYCGKQTDFPFVSLIKRKAAPVVDNDAPENQSYVRIDFANVQIASLQWSDDDVIQETCSFRADKVTIQYWTQTDQPSVDADDFLRLMDKPVQWNNQAGVVTDGE